MPDSTLPLVDPFHDPSLPSLADALSKFEAMPDVTLSRKARARAAVAMLGRLLHRSPAEIPAQATYLRQRFMQLKHSPSGLTAKSLANCKSELRYLVRMVCGRGSKCQFRPLSAGWACLRDKIKDEPAHWTLSRFMAFCSAVGVMPEAVDDSVIERFRAALLDSGEVIKPEAVVRRTITTWNQLAATEPQWPEATLFMPPRRIKRWTIEPERFLEAFRQDVDRWLERLSKVDPESEDCPVRPLRPASLRLHRHQIFKAASALVFTGQPIETVTSLACLVDFETFKKILAYLRERQGGHPTTALLGLARTLKAIAKHHGLVGASDVARMGRICANYVRDLETYTPKS